MTRHVYRVPAALLLLSAALLASCVDASTYAVIALVDEQPGVGLRKVIGHVEKSPSNPLFVQDKPWEPRLDNGYPNVVYDAAASDGAAPWQLWYGDCVRGCGTQILLYANSTDGIAWDKPELGLFNLSGVRPDLAAIGTRNNVVLKGGGIGVYRDAHEADARARFKAFGSGCFSEGGYDSCINGVASSPDGLTWGRATAVPWQPPQRYDCHNNLFWDDKRGVYLAQTRVNFHPRMLGVAPSAAGAFAWDAAAEPHVALNGTLDHQIYSQVAWPWHNAYLGIAMVYDATSADEKVHCRLTSSRDGSNYTFVDGGLTGADFIPLGPTGATACQPGGWAPVVVDSRPLSDCAAYRSGARPTHYVCDGPRARAADMPLLECRAACSALSTCAVMQWQGEQSSNYSSLMPGQCFLFSSCDRAVPYRSKLAPTFCMETQSCARAAPGANAFDSHICFAAATPVTLEDEVRVYYMGGNGPHSGDRNSSFGLATMGIDRFAGLRGTGNASLAAVLCDGDSLTVTADVLAGGSVRVGVRGVEGLSPEDSVAVTTNVTDARVVFHTGVSLKPLVGQSVTVEVVLTNAIVYTVGFA